MNEIKQKAERTMKARELAFEMEQEAKRAERDNQPAGEDQLRYILRLCSNIVLQHGSFIDRLVTDVYLNSDLTTKEADGAIRRALEVLRTIHEEKKESTFEKGIERLVNDFGYIGRGSIATSFSDKWRRFQVRNREKNLP